MCSSEKLWVQESSGKLGGSLRGSGGSRVSGGLERRCQHWEDLRDVEDSGKPMPGVRPE